MCPYWVRSNQHSLVKSYSSDLGLRVSDPKLDGLGFIYARSQLPLSRSYRYVCGEIGGSTFVIKVLGWNPRSMWNNLVLGGFV